ncbi:MAG: ComF family protein [Firmicutes bacterium]|nr:ComF family protein [Bacillota bacterium]
MKFLNDIIDTLSELVYPNKCISCREVIEFHTDKWLCPKCKDKFEPISGKTCKICGIPLHANDICMTCRDRKTYFKRAFCVYEYKNEVRTAIHRIKFRGCPQNLKYFAPIAADFAYKNGFEGADYIVYVPMYPSDKRKRGYNQSEIFAKELEKCGVAKRINALKKVRKTQHQHDLTGEQRIKNLKKAFEVIDPEKIKGRKLLLVDDIFTTGTTANECSKALIKAGAESVEVLCIAIVNRNK